MMCTIGSSRQSKEIVHAEEGDVVAIETTIPLNQALVSTVAHVVAALEA